MSPFGPAADSTGPAELFTCPRCGAVSHHPDDKAFGYCGRCHAYTGLEEGSVLPASVDDLAAVQGSIVGPGGAYDRAAVVIDNRNALRLDEVEVAAVSMHGISRSTGEAGAQDAYVLELTGVRGRDNGAGHIEWPEEPEARGRVVVIGDGDALAHLVVETLSLYARHDVVLHDILVEEMKKVIEQLGAPRWPAGRTHMAEVGGALIFDHLNISVLCSDDPEKDLAPPVAYELGGRINQTPDRVSTIVLSSAMQAARLCGHLMYAIRNDAEGQAGFGQRVAESRAAGVYPHTPPPTTDV